MTNPNLIEIASNIADYMVKVQFKNEIELYPDAITFEDTNGDIIYRPAIQQVFNDHYDFVSNALDSASLRVKDELETMI